MRRIFFSPAHVYRIYTCTHPCVIHAPIFFRERNGDLQSILCHKHVVFDALPKFLTLSFSFVSLRKPVFIPTSLCVCNPSSSFVRLSTSFPRHQYDGDNFFTVSKLGEIVATPMLLCLVAVEVSDVVFAVDSIPAVFGVTEDPLIVFSSNIFAIAGLRSLYIVLSRAVKDLKYLEPSVALVLGFIGAKMIAEYFGYCLPTTASLGVVAAFLGIGVGASVVFPGTSDSSGDTNRDDDIK